MSNALEVRWDCLPYINGQGLDLGCGDFRIHDWLIGVDINAGSGPRGPNVIADARNLKIFGSESQDFIFSSHLLNELGDWNLILAEWWRLLKPYGYLILYLPITDKCHPRAVVDAMVTLRPWQFVEARVNGSQMFQVYRKCDLPTELVGPDPEKICAVMKLGAHGDALWASSVFPHLKEQGYYTTLYCQETGEQVLRHDPHIDRIIKFESRVPMGELGELFQWMEAKYKNSRILVECVEGTLLPSPNKIQYHFPKDLRHKLMNHNYLEVHHLQARVPLEPRVKFYPSQDEMVWANEIRSKMQPNLVVLVPNGSSVSKYWPYAAEFVKELLKRTDVTVVMIGDERGCVFEEHPRFVKLGISLDVRKCMTIAQLATVVVGQETGMLNSVSFEKDVHKIVLLSHSSVENLTRDWLNTVSVYENPGCFPCHRLHYDWSGCNKHEETNSAKCQEMIKPDKVLALVCDYIDSVSLASASAMSVA